MKSGNLNFVEPSGPLQACNGADLPLPLLKYQISKKSVQWDFFLVNDQLDAQLLYFIIRLLQPSTCFEQRRAHHQDVKLY